jgi:hypothetical protein
MTYSRPEIAALGTASLLIEGYGKNGPVIEGPPDYGNPAYDLDE